MNKRAILGVVFLLSASGVSHASAAESPASIELLEEAAIQSAVEQIRPAVVRIDLVGATTLASEGEGTGSTSGLIVGSDVYVLTSSFAFAAPPASILVSLDEARQSAAELVAIDHSRQLALLKLKSGFDVKPPAVAPEGELAVGQWAIAVGRVLESERPSISVGIVSALGRIQGKAVQTDAAISPVNYGGPLIDLAGRVIGILTPLAPDDAGASGAEWYDSGIGFAVPLEQYAASLARLKTGEDLYRGLAGIALEKGNAMESPAKISNIRRRGPAERAGLMAGDVIVAVGDVDTPTQAIFRRILGRYYAGDSIALSVLRDESSKKIDVLLVRELAPFRHAALGLLPKLPAENEAAGVVVERLQAGGSAEVAGIETGDRIVRIANREVSSVEELAGSLGGFAPGEKVQLNVVRESISREMAIELGERSAALFASRVDEARSEDIAVTGTDREMKLPEFALACPLYEPAAAKSEQPGLLVVLQSGEAPIEPEMISQWKRGADENNLLLAMPRPQEGRGWSGGDLEYVKQLLRTLFEHEKIDRRRVALVGMDCPNRVTFAMWLANRELVRGVVLGSAETPPQIRLPENELESPCLLLISASQQARETQRLVSQLEERGFAAASAEKLTPADVAAWTDTLDRL